MIYVKSVRSSLKKGCDVELGPLTVIVGPNGAGKSTIVQSIELSANGQVSDMEGRARVKLHTALARLFPDGVSRFAKITLSDGTQCSWELENGAKAGSFKKPEHEAPVNLRWPVQDLMDVLRGDANTVASWLEQQVVGDLKDSQLLSALPPAVREIAREFVKKTRKSDFMALAKEAKNEAKSLRTQATRTETTIESMTEGIAPPLEDDERAALEATLTQMTAPQPGVSQETYDKERAIVEGLAADIAAMQESLQKLPDVPEAVMEAVTKVTKWHALIKTHAEVFGVEECWVCGNSKPDIAASAGKMREAKAKLATHIQNHEQRASITVDIGNKEAKLLAQAHYLKSMKVVAGSDDTERRALMGRIASDDAARKTWANADAQRAEIEQLRSRAELLALAGNAFEKAGKNYLDKCKSQFENAVSHYLPGEERLGVDLESGRLGLVRDMELHSALSGAEWSRVLMALAAAQESGRTPAVLVPEDRAWDSGTLTAVMKALLDCRAQVIIMATVEPEPIEGWTILRVQAE